MKVLWLLTRDPGPTGAALREQHVREHEVRTIDLRGEIDFTGVLEAVAAADRVVSW